MCKYRKTNSLLSLLFHYLYGRKSYSEIKDYHNLALYKKYILKLIKSFKYAIEMNLNDTDNYHKKQLKKLLCDTDKNIRELKELNSIDQLMIAFEAEFIFLLIGYMPHRIKDTKNNKENWILDVHRKIIYTQNIDQKKNVIYDLTRKEPYCSKLPTLDKLQIIYSKECNNDPTKFVEWFKNNYSDIYLELF